MGLGCSTASLELYLYGPPPSHGQSVSEQAVPQMSTFCVLYNVRLSESPHQMHVLSTLVPLQTFKGCFRMLKWLC